MNIPSARQLKLARFKRPDFRSTTRAKHREGWTWARALYRVRRWLAQADVVNAIAAPTRQISRAWSSLRSYRPARMPKLSPTFVEGELVTAAMFSHAIGHPAAPRARRSLRSRLMGARQSKPARLSGRRPGAHRLDQLAALPSRAYMSALDARQRYVIANLLRLQQLATSRAFGESTWMEARRADHYAV